MHRNAKAIAPHVPADVIAAQFAGGMSIARLAEEWELDAATVEQAIRSEFRLLIPVSAGGAKPTREQVRKQRREVGAGVPMPWLIEDLDE